MVRSSISLLYSMKILILFFSDSIAQWPAYLHPPIKNIKDVIFITSTALRIINTASAMLQISELGCDFKLCLN